MLSHGCQKEKYNESGALIIEVFHSYYVDSILSLIINISILLSPLFQCIVVIYV